MVLVFLPPRRRRAGTVDLKQHEWGAVPCVCNPGPEALSTDLRKELWSIIALRSYLLLAGAKWERNAFKVGKYCLMSIITYEDDPENNTRSTWYARRYAQNAHFLTEPRTTRASYEFIFLEPPTSVYTSNNSQLALLMHCNLRDTLSWILARIALAWMVLQLHWLPYPIPQRPRSLCSTLFSSCIQRRGSRNVLRFFLDVLSPE